MPTTERTISTWWYTVDPASLDGARNPTTTLAGTYTNKTLNAGPGRFSLSLILSGSAAKLDLWNATLRTAIGATNAPKISSRRTPGHRASEHLDPALQTFASSGVGASGVAAGQLCGNVTTGSLSTVTVPTVLLSGLTECVENYAATNSLLDVYIGGCHVLGGFVTVISKTQPDRVDGTAPQAGAGGPYTLSASSGLTVNTCKDKNNTVVPLAICHGRDGVFELLQVHDRSRRPPVNERVYTPGAWNGLRSASISAAPRRRPSSSGSIAFEELARLRVPTERDRGYDAVLEGDGDHRAPRRLDGRDRRRADPARRRDARRHHARRRW